MAGQALPERDQIDLVLRQFAKWRDMDEPMVEAIGDTLADSAGIDSQEQARRVLDTVIEVLEEWNASVRDRWS